MKLIAKTQKGTEFMHSKANAFFAPDSSANKICKIMNNTKFMLKSENEVWHVYNYDSTQEMYVTHAVEEYNANDLHDVKKCKECGEYFWQTDEERIWFTDRNMKAPCRCYSCRKKKH